MATKRFFQLEQGRTNLADGEHFSYGLVDSGSLVLVPENQQMVVIESLLIDGELQIDGQVFVEEFQQVEIPTPPVFEQVPQFSFKEVLNGEVITIPSEQEMFLTDFIAIEGTLNIDGALAIGEKEGEPVAQVIYFDNFSLKKIESGTTVNIPVNQQMVLDDSIEVEGNLEIDGELALFSSPPEQEDEFLPWYEIPSGNVISIKQYREYFLSEFLNLDGTLEIDGRLVIGA